MDHFASLTGRQYHLFDYHGHPEAERVVVMMGSGAETVRETMDWLVSKGEKVGLVLVRLFRPFDLTGLMGVLPKSTKSIAVLDRTKEPGALGEPLYQDVVTALSETGRAARVVGGRYGLSSKEFTPSMAKAVFDNLSATTPKNHFTVGINDDVTHLSLAYDPDFDIEPASVVRAVFFGLGSDGTVSSNKQTIKIIGQETGQAAQGYFVYDSKKSGAMTVSHLRFAKNPIHSTYLIKRASFVACHYAPLLDRQDVLDSAADGATFLLNTHHPATRPSAPCPVRCSSRSSRRRSASSSSTPSPWRAPLVSIGTSAPSCKSASSSCRACSRWKRRSSTFATVSRRPTASAGPRW